MPWLLRYVFSFYKSYKNINFVVVLGIHFFILLLFSPEFFFFFLFCLIDSDRQQLLMF